jgi:hypothetical protein
MPLYPLGISRRRDVPSVPKQAAGSVDVRWSLAGELACAYIDAPHHAIPAMLHATVLGAIHRRISVLPVRFGATLRDESEIRSLMEQRSGDLLDQLGRLDRTCEMGLQIAAPPPAGQHQLAPVAHSPPKAAIAGTSEPPSALEYIAARRSHYQRADGNVERDGLIVQRFVERLHGYYREWRKLPSALSQRIRLAFLVERERVAAFRGCVEGECGGEQEGRCVILGPWPPYSFV